MIDEKKLIRDLRKYADELGTVRGEIELANGVLKAISIVKNQPKEGEWIPVEERLPEDNQAVLTCKNKQISILIWKSEKRMWLEPKGNWLWSYCMVEKWQPLPELPEPFSSGD